MDHVAKKQKTKIAFLSSQLARRLDMNHGHQLYISMLKFNIKTIVQTSKKRTLWLKMSLLHNLTIDLEAALANLNCLSSTKPNYPRSTAFLTRTTLTA